MTDSTILRVVMVVWIRFAASITGSWPIVTAGGAASARTTARGRKGTPGPRERNLVAAGRGGPPPGPALSPPGPPPSGAVRGWAEDYSPPRRGAPPPPP